MALAVGIALLSAVDSVLNDSAPSPVWRGTVAGLAMLGLCLRRRRPLAAVAVLCVGVTAESILWESPDEAGVLVGLILVAFSVAAYAPLRDALVGAAMLGMTEALVIALDPSDSLANIIPTIGLFVVAPMVIGGTVQRRQRDLAALTLETQALAQEMVAAVDAERRRIARELHDVVSHAVTLVAVQAEAGRATLDTDPEATRRSLGAIADVSRDALTELDRLLRLLREEETANDELAGLARVDALVEGARAAGLTVSVERAGPRQELAPAVDQCAFRVLQEGLTNALRHSSGGRATVSIVHLPGAVRLEVDSDGRRHRSAYGGTGRGLAGLRERVLGMGGSLEATPTDTGGFSLRATLPAGVA